MATISARRVIFGVLALQISTLGFAQQSGKQSSYPAAPLRIGTGDLIDITMFQEQDLSGHFRVNEKGDIVIPLLGPIHVQDETADEAATQIEKRYVNADILQPAESHATVFISEYANQGISVNGAVKTPGVYPALGVRMLSDIMTSAGGVLPTAASKVIITRKSDPEKPITVAYNPEALSPVVPPVQIFPGDSLMVPRAGIVYVIGNVNHSGVYVLDGRNTLTVMEAMGLAGGGGRGASLNSSQLVRTEEDGRRVEINIQVSRINNGKAPDVVLKDGDILYVPTSHTKLIAQQAIASALSIGTQITVYRTAVQ